MSLAPPYHECGHGRTCLTTVRNLTQGNVISWLDVLPFCYLAFATHASLILDSRNPTPQGFPKVHLWDTSAFPTSLPSARRKRTYTLTCNFWNSCLKLAHDFELFFPFQMSISKWSDLKWRLIIHCREGWPASLPCSHRPTWMPCFKARRSAAYSQRPPTSSSSCSAMSLRTPPSSAFSSQ